MSTNSALSKYKFLGLFPLVMAQIALPAIIRCLPWLQLPCWPVLMRQCQTSSWPTLFILCVPAA